MHGSNVHIIHLQARERFLDIQCSPNKMKEILRNLGTDKFSLETQVMKC